jgi:pyruvate kinase
MRSPAVGVMIARGDLAVECGFERLAEVQEEILWVCEAAHVPVVWATQVLEGLAKTGRPSRAEITDAAMGERAECVMLNKGPHVVGAVRTLDDILRRMQEHTRKKRAMLRPLRVAGLTSTPVGPHARPGYNDGDTGTGPGSFAPPSPG